MSNDNDQKKKDDTKRQYKIAETVVADAPKRPRPIDEKSNSDSD